MIHGTTIEVFRKLGQLTSPLVYCRNQDVEILQRARTVRLRADFEFDGIKNTEITAQQNGIHALVETRDCADVIFIHIVIATMKFGKQTDHATVARRQSCTALKSALQTVEGVGQ